MIKAKITALRGKSVIIVGKDGDGHYAAYIVPRDKLSSNTVGREVEISPEDVPFVEYGLDWRLIYEDSLCIDSTVLHDMLYSNGIVDYQDLINNPSVVTAAINQMLVLTLSNMINNARKAIGGS